MQTSNHEKINHYLKLIVDGRPGAYRAFKQERVNGILFYSGLNFIKYLSEQTTAEKWEAEVFYDAIEYYKNLIRMKKFEIESSILLKLKSLISEQVYQNNYIAFAPLLLLVHYKFVANVDEAISYVFEKSQALIGSGDTDKIGHAYFALGLIHSNGFSKQPVDEMLAEQYLIRSSEYGHDMASVFLWIKNSLNTPAKKRNYEISIDFIKKIADKHILKAINELVGFIGVKQGFLESSDGLKYLMRAAYLGDQLALKNLSRIYQYEGINREQEEFIYTNIAKLAHNYRWECAFYYLNTMVHYNCIIEPMDKSKLEPKKEQYILAYKKAYTKIVISKALFVNDNSSGIGEKILKLIINELENNKKIKLVEINSMELDWSLLQSSLIKISQPYTLSLSGFTLSLKYLELLRSIITSAPYLTRLEIQDINIDNNNPGSLLIFISSIIKLNKLSALSIDYNYGVMTITVWEILANTLANNLKIQKLALLNFLCYENLEASEELVLTIAANQLLSAIFNNLHIKKLDISGWDLNTDNIIHITELLETNKTLTKLRLVDCSLDDAALGLLGASLAKNTVLTEVDFSKNDFKEAGAKQLFTSLANNQASALRKVDFSGSASLADSAFIKQLAKFIQTDKCLWETLCLKGVAPHLLTENNLKIICLALANAKHIKYVSFEDNNFDKINGANLIAYFSAINASITLNLSNCKLAPDIIAAIELARSQQKQRSGKNKRNKEQKNANEQEKTKKLSKDIPSQTKNLLENAKSSETKFSYFFKPYVGTVIENEPSSLPDNTVFHKYVLYTLFPDKPPFISLETAVNASNEFIKPKF